MTARPHSRATAATAPRSAAISRSTSATLWHTLVPTSIWDWRNSGATRPPRRFSHSAKSSGGATWMRSRVSGSTIRYSSSIPIVKGGSLTMLGRIHAPAGRSRPRGEGFFTVL
jgi:hypothetical protein